jgi:RND family efflux transporter MFP subunit
LIFNKILIIILSILSLSSCKPNLKIFHRYPKVHVSEIHQIQAPLVKEYIGILKPVQKVIIRARVEGFLEKRLFLEGSYVKKNQVLYEIDPKPLQAKLLAAQGMLDKATADVIFQKAQYERYKELLPKKAISKASYDQQYAAYLASLGNEESAKGNLSDAEINLSYCTIKSPINGLVGKTYVDVGNLVSGTEKTQLLKIVQLDPLRVEFNPATSDLKDFLQYKANKPFKVQVKIPKIKDRIWDGVVDFYDNDVTEDTSTLLLRTTILNKDLLLRPDLYVNVSVTLDPQHQFKMVPIEYVISVQERHQLLVVDAKHQIALRNLKLGRIHDNLIEVHSGLHEGDMLVKDEQMNEWIGKVVEPIK